MASVPDFEAKEKYKKANNLLAATVPYFDILMLLASWARCTEGVPTYFFPLILFVPSVALFFAIQVRKFHGGLYFLVASLLAASFLNATRELEAVMIDMKAIILWTIMYLPVAAGAGLEKAIPRFGLSGSQSGFVRKVPVPQRTAHNKRIDLSRFALTSSATSLVQAPLPCK